MASVTVKHVHYKFLGYFAKYRILIDGTEAGILKRDQTLSFDLPEGPHIIQARLKQHWFRSEQLSFTCSSNQTTAFACSFEVNDIDGAFHPIKAVKNGRGRYKVLLRQI